MTMATREEQEFGIWRDGDHYLAMKRWGTETHDIREWVTPDAPEVAECARALWLPDPDDFALNCWRWVGGSFRYVLELPDYWRFPAELIRTHEQYEKAIAAYRETKYPGRPPSKPSADCDCRSFLLCSLLIAGNIDAWVALGDCGGPHAWVTAGDYILEPTYRESAMDVMLAADPWMLARGHPEYQPKYIFNNCILKHLTN